MGHKVLLTEIYELKPIAVWDNKQVGRRAQIVAPLAIRSEAGVRVRDDALIIVRADHSDRIVAQYHTIEACRYGNRLNAVSNSRNESFLLLLQVPLDKHGLCASAH